MENQTKNTPISEFLAIMTGSREVGLAIARDDKELEDFSRFMDGEGFSQAEGVFDLLKSPKTYLRIGEDMDKNVYDFVVQYSTGSVQIFNVNELKNILFSPDYKNSAIVLLVDQDNLHKIQAKGFDLLSASGPAYKS